jgi:hypothetical protein
MSVQKPTNKKESELEKSLGFDVSKHDLSNVQYSQLAIPSKPKYAVTVPMNVRIPVDLREGLDRLIEAESVGYSKVTLQNIIVELIRTLLTQKGYMDK